MINPLGQIGLAQAVEASRTDRVKPGTPVTNVAPSTSESRPSATPAAALVAQGPPFDNVKVGQIRAALAAGIYHVDPRAIAEVMIAQDLPAKSTSE